jgi:hypothetical protein
MTVARFALTFGFTLACLNSGDLTAAFDFAQ